MAEACGTCRGRGVIPITEVDPKTGKDKPMPPVTCPTCQGTGEK